MKTLLLLVSLIPSALFAAKGNAELEKCLNYSQQLETLSQFDADSERLKDSKTVDAVLSVFKPESVVPRDYHKVLRNAAGRLQKFSETDVSTVLWHPAACNAAVPEYRAVKGMLASALHGDLTPEQKTKALQVSRQYIKNQARVPGTLLEKTIQVDLLGRLSDGGFLKTDHASKDAILQLKKKSEAIKADLTPAAHQAERWPSSSEDFKKMPEADRARLVERIKTEIEKTEILRKDLETVCRKLDLA